MIYSIVLFFAFVVIIGGAFYRLAKHFHKKKWNYLLLGTGTYFIVSGIVRSLVNLFTMYLSEPIQSYFLTVLMNFTPTAIGILTCVYLHKRLEKQWKLEGFVSDTDVLDDNLNQESKLENTTK